MTRHRTKAPSKRQLRVGEELRHALSAVLTRGDFRDPDLVNASITVTEVRVSPDLRNATAYVMPLGGADAELVAAALQRAAHYVRGQVAREVELRYMPALSFETDESFDQAARIDRLLRDAAGRETGPAQSNDEDR
ncbi:MAG: 30S ribosome-binding factor RbfA [Alphaproteobacteria bacterium]|nr:30S ribosome-binding factor RbfA [Alphaproteobacteria bacterium]